METYLAIALIAITAIDLIAYFFLSNRLRVLTECTSERIDEHYERVSQIRRDLRDDIRSLIPIIDGHRKTLDERHFALLDYLGLVGVLSQAKFEYRPLMEEHKKQDIRNKSK